MNENLSTKLYEAYQIAAERESLMDEYTMECRNLNSKQAAVDHVSILKRLKYGIIPLACFWLGGYLLDTTEYTLATTFAEFDMLQKSYVIFAYSGLALGILLMIGAKFLYYHSKKYISKCADIREDQNALREVFKEELNKINRKPGAYISGLPQKYHTTCALGYMREYVHCGAPSIKELVQMYEASCHRERMENMQERLLWEAQEQSDRLNQLEAQVNYVTYYR